MNKKTILTMMLVGLLALPATAGDKTMYGKVVRVYDGDTLTININYAIDLKFRLIGVDTPEIRKGDKAHREAGKAIRDKVKELVLDKVVRIVTGKSDKDPYNRILAYIYIDDLMLNQWLIEQGYAVPLFYRPNTQYQQEFEYLSEIAREEGKGLWSGEVFDVTPKQVRDDAQDDI
jgi:micrococcal nuclease